MLRIFTLVDEGVGDAFHSPEQEIYRSFKISTGSLYKFQAKMLAIMKAVEGGLQAGSTISNRQRAKMSTTIC